MFSEPEFDAVKLRAVEPGDGLSSSIILGAGVSRAVAGVR